MQKSPAAVAANSLCSATGHSARPDCGAASVRQPNAGARGSRTATGAQLPAADGGAATVCERPGWQGARATLIELTGRGSDRSFGPRLSRRSRRLRVAATGWCGRCAARACRRAGSWARASRRGSGARERIAAVPRPRRRAVAPIAMLGEDREADPPERGTAARAPDDIRDLEGPAVGEQQPAVASAGNPRQALNACGRKLLRLHADVAVRTGGHGGILPSIGTSRTGASGWIESPRR